MAARLRELGFEVDPAPIEARKAAGKPVGRPHLAAAVLAHPANAARLAEEGHADVSSFIPAYLIQGKPGYVARTHPTVEEAIGWIHDAAGVAVWAHPFWDIEDEARCWRRSTATAPRASTGSRRSTSPIPRSRRCWWRDRCAELGLLRTGSSDYHGPDHRLFGALPGVRPARPRAEPGADRLRHAGGAGARRCDGLCIWLTGLSGSGKSTVGRLAAGQLRDLGHRVEVLDGDDVRQNLASDLGFSREDRDKNVRRHRLGVRPARPQRRGGLRGGGVALPRAARRGAGADGRALRGGLRARVGGGVRAPRRKGPLRARPRRGDPGASPGVSDPYEEPSAPELRLDTEQESAEDSAARLVALVEERLAGEPVGASA